MADIHGLTVKVATGTLTLRAGVARATLLPSSTQQVVAIQGPPGPAGPAGPSYEPITYTRSVPASSWPIPHNLGRYPSVDVIVDGEKVYPDINYPDLNNVEVVFGSPTPGVAILR